MKRQKKPHSICLDFDDWAEGYEECLNSYIRIFGETDDYFQYYKLACLKRSIPRIESTGTILDFGCGIGKLTSIIAQTFPESTVYGYDISTKCIEIARKKWGHFKNLVFSNKLPSKRYFDLIIAANVFHHIKSPDRIGKILQLKDIIKEEGKIVIFEHNPLNPLTRHIVRTCPFDSEAELISLAQFIGLANKNGLRIRLKCYIIFFPRFLSLFRCFEPFLGFLPLGAQYMLFLGSDGEDIKS